MIKYLLLLLIALAFNVEFIYMVIPLVILIIRDFIVWKSARSIVNNLQHFTWDQDLHIYKEGLPELYLTEKPLKHLTLLIHGHACSSYDFEVLKQRLKKENIPFYAPTLSGCASNNLDLLSHTQYVDWQRDTDIAYNLAANLAEEVSIVGHSMGANFALEIASRYPVKNLVAIAPNLAPTKFDAIIAKLLLMPIVSQMIGFFMPIFKKPIRKDRVCPVDTLDINAARKAMVYYYLPASALISLSKGIAFFKREILGRLKVKKLFLLFGEQDHTIDTQAVIDIFKQQNASFDLKFFPNSGHNILEDYDKEKVCDYIVKIIK